METRTNSQVLEKFKYDGNLTKEEAATKIASDLQECGYTIVESDFDRPWGGFHRIADEQSAKFIAEFFEGVELPFIPGGARVSPKLLVPEAGKALSWQKHKRRAEFWRVVDGPVGVFLSETDEQPAEPQIYQNGETINMGPEMRHRLLGVSKRGVVAEIWIHTDPEHPSDEADIERMADDFGRESK